MQLTEKEKARIRLEEIYRKEIREGLLSPSRKGLLAFFNSAFGLWILSAVFITGGGTILSKSIDHRATLAAEAAAKAAEESEAERKRAEHVERLDFEIGYRFSQVQTRLYRESKSERSADETTKTVRDILDGLIAQPGQGIVPLYPEFSMYSLLGLVSELSRNIAGDAREEIEQVIHDITGIVVFLEVQEAPLSEPTKVAGAIISEIVRSRWKDSGWYFLDGGREFPFP